MKKLFLVILLFLGVIAQAQQTPFAFRKGTDSAPLGTPNVAWANKPVDLQLYARDADDSATVTISGTFSPDGYDSVFVRMYKNGTSLLKTSTKLNYAGIFAPFSITHRIHAELSEYRFVCYVKAPTTGDTTLLFTADSVVCGDAYIVAGQSNGQAPDLNVTTNDQYCRTFGVQADSLNLSTYLASDTLWSRSSANYNGFASYPAGNYPKNVGVLGMTLQKYIRDSCSIPTCFINGTEQGTSILAHLRNNANPQELVRTTLYGRTLYRATKSGLVSKIKAIIWYQGEIDVSNPRNANYNYVNPKGIAGYSNYANRFDSLFKAWKTDYTSLKKVYVMQVRPLSCDSSNHAMELRETQRQLQNTYVDTVQLVSTLGIGNYQDCHYAYQGYQQLAGHLFKNLDREFYRTTSLTDTVGIRPPTVRKAFFLRASKDTIAVTFNNSYPVGRPNDSLGNAIEGYFYLNRLGGWSSGQITTMSMRNDTMFLKLAGSTTATRLSLYPKRGYGVDTLTTVYNAPFIRNSRGLALLSFDNVPIFEPESNALFTRMPTATYPRQVDMDSLIKRYKSHSVFTGDALYIYANADTGMANVNWYSGVADSFRCKINGGMTFLANRGYTSNGSTGYLNTQYTPSVSASLFLVNAGNVAVYCHDDINSTFSGSVWDKAPFGTTSLSNTYLGIIPRGNAGTANRYWTNVNDVTSLGTQANSDGRGLFLSNRVSTSSVQGYRNGTQVYTNTSQTLGAFSTNPIYVGAYNANGTTTSFYTGRIAMFRIGGSWNTTQITDFYNDTEWYMIKVGASYTQP